MEDAQQAQATISPSLGEIAWVDPKTLQPDERNRNTHTPEQIERLAQIIKYQGWRWPIIVSKQDGLIKAGHGRLQAALKLGLDKVPVSYQDFTDPEQAYAFMISDNAIASWAELDFAGINTDLADLGPSFDLDMLGLERFQLDPPGTGSGNTKPNSGALAERFLVPPFSVLDARQGYWQERKRALLDEMGEGGESRENTLSDSELMGGINNGVSILDPVLAEAMLLWFAPARGKIFDPFAGDTVFGYMAKRGGHDFSGIELRKEQAQLNQSRTDALTTTGSATYYNDTSENIDKYIEDKTQDMLFSCPPYFNLEVYSDSPQDLSNQGKYEDFLALYSKILSAAAAKLKENRFAVIVISEVRDQSTGQFYGIVPDTIAIMERAGLQFYNEMVLVSPCGTAQLRAARYMATRKVVRLHQNVLVFFKGNTASIKDTFPLIDTDYEKELGEQK